MISSMAGGQQLRASTKPGSQLTEITSNNALTITQNADQVTERQPNQNNTTTSYLVLGETSFAAAQNEDTGGTASKQLIASSGSRMISDDATGEQPPAATLNAANQDLINSKD